jgi:hypothetical protein
MEMYLDVGIIKYFIKNKMKRLVENTKRYLPRSPEAIFSLLFKIILCW